MRPRAAGVLSHHLAVEVDHFRWCHEDDVHHDDHHCGKTRALISLVTNSLLGRGRGGCLNKGAYQRRGRAVHKIIFLWGCVFDDKEKQKKPKKQRQCDSFLATLLAGSTGWQREFICGVSLLQFLCAESGSLPRDQDSCQGVASQTGSSIRVRGQHNCYFNFSLQKPKIMANPSCWPNAEFIALLKSWMIWKRSWGQIRVPGLLVIFATATASGGKRELDIRLQTSPILTCLCSNQDFWVSVRVFCVVRTGTSGQKRKTRNAW